MNRNTRVTLKFLIVTMSILAMFGCSRPPKAINLVPNDFNMIHRHDASVKIVVEGGTEPGKETTISEITNDIFKEALTKAIHKSNLFREVLVEGGDYLLKVTINNQEMGERGFADMDVDVMTSWQLTDNNTLKVIWKDVVATNYKATVSDAFDGGKRYRVAKEKAANKNIQLGIQELSKLSL